MEADFDLTGIRINADLYMDDGLVANDTLTYTEFNIGTAYGDVYNFVSGTDPTLYPWGVHIIPEWDSVNERWLVAMDGGMNEPEMQVALTVITYDNKGSTSASREYVFYCSPLTSGTLCDSYLEPYLEFDVSGFPTQQPTESPTLSNAPSTTPSSFPTVLTVTATTLEYQIHPDISALDSNGTIMPMHTFNTLDTAATWSLPFKQLIGAAPGVETTFGLSVAGRQYGTTTVAISSNRAIAYVTSVVKTSDLYVDNRTLSVAYQVSDSIGHTQVDTSTDISMYVNNSILNKYAAFSCYSPNSISGIGLCVGEVESSWFSDTGSVSLDLTIGTSLATSTYVAITLQKTPITTITDTDPYMVLDLPYSPLMPGDNFTLSIIANTAGYALSSWMVTLSYSAALLSYHSTSIGNLYATASPVISGSSLILSSELDAGVVSNDSVGGAIEVAYVTFFVLKNATDGVYSNTMNMYVNAMNESGVMYQGGGYSYIQDSRDHGDYINGQLSINASSYVGVMAYSAQNELLNTATLNGVDVYSNILVEGILSGTDTDNEIVTSDSICSVSDHTEEALDVVTNEGQPCVVRLSSYKSSGSAEALVAISYNDLNATVPFRIWYPSTVEVMVEDDVLSRISIT